MTEAHAWAPLIWLATRRRPSRSTATSVPTACHGRSPPRRPRRSWIAPAPASRARTRDQRLADVIRTVEGANIGKKLKEKLLFDLGIAKRNSAEDTAYVAQRIAEEASSIMESVQVIMAERVDGASIQEAKGAAGLLQEVPEGR